MAAGISTTTSDASTVRTMIRSCVTPTEGEGFSSGPLESPETDWVTTSRSTSTATIFSCISPETLDSAKSKSGSPGATAILSSKKPPSEPISNTASSEAKVAVDTELSSRPPEQAAATIATTRASATTRADCVMSVVPISCLLLAKRVDAARPYRISLLDEKTKSMRVLFHESAETCQRYLD